MSGLWYAIKPHQLKASRNADSWVFAEYLETPSERGDGQWFRVYLFRNKERTIFGALVHEEKDFPRSNSRDWATKVVVDRTFRERHLTSDEGLISLWKRR